MKILFARFFLFITVICLFMGIMPLSSFADASSEEKQVSHLINVVYDDSNSMLMKGRLRWCYAKYSLEVFSAMMQDKDCMNVYFMSEGSSDPLLAGLSGDKSQQQKNINTIHDTVTETYGTPFSSIKKAYDDLKKNGGYDEKWLMVITDGESFDTGEQTADLDSLFSDCSKYNIKIVYLAIGEALTPTDNANKGIYVYIADGEDPSGRDGILSNVTLICQKVFERPILETATSSNLTLDIPASEIIVFAQGKNVSIGDLEGTKKTFSEASMSEADKSKATNNSNYPPSVINVAELDASIVTFTPKGNKYIPEGTYDISIDADEYVVYYGPCLDVILEMRDGNGDIVTDKYIPIGSYTVDYWLTYPEGHAKYGEKLPSGIFDVEYTLTCNTNGSDRIVNSKNIDLKEGTNIITVIAEYLKYSTSEASLEFVVEDFSVSKLDVAIDYNQKDYRLSTLEKDNEGITVSVSKNGNPIPDNEWETFTLEYSIDNPDFEIVKNGNSTLTVFPRYNDGDKNSTATGDIDFDITVSSSNDHRITDSGTVSANINIYDDVSATSLGLTVSDQGSELDNMNFEDQDSDRKVTIDWDGHLLTKEQYDALDLSCKINDDDFIADITLDPYVEGKPTTATIRFSLKNDENGNPPEAKTLNGTKSITVDATIDIDGQISKGETKAAMHVKKILTREEIIKFFIVLSILIFLFLGYWPNLIKKYLPVKSYIKKKGSTTSRDLYWYADMGTLFSVLIPFRPVKNKKSVTVSYSSKQHGDTRNIVLEIVATGPQTICCKNKKDGEPDIKIPETGSFKKGFKVNTVGEDPTQLILITNK